MSEVRVIKSDYVPDIPMFALEEAKLRREAKRKEREKAEKGMHHTALVRPQGEVRIFSMNTSMTHYYGIHVDVSGLSLSEFTRAYNRACLGNIPQVEFLVVRFKDVTLAFDLEDGKEL